MPPDQNCSALGVLDGFHLSFMKSAMHGLAKVLFGLALFALVWLLLPDIWISFHPSLRHQQAGALALIFVGSSFICIQLSDGKRLKEVLQGLLLGLAFVLWGSEQFIPPGVAATAMDSVVIVIFVADLGLVIASHLKAPPKS
jgi:hypothetical protein